jgi:hypothetical protein
MGTRDERRFTVFWLLERIVLGLSVTERVFAPMTKS